jgi:hypothetical protein
MATFSINTIVLPEEKVKAKAVGISEYDETNNMTVAGTLQSLVAVQDLPITFSSLQAAKGRNEIHGSCGG